MLTKIVRRSSDGRQWWSWVARHETATIIEHALETDALSGPINAASPNPVRNAELAEALGRVLGRQQGSPMPASELRILLGEMADQLMLGSRRLEPRKPLATGYQFRFPELEVALRHELEAAGLPMGSPRAYSTA